MKKLIIILLTTSICLGDTLILKNKQSYKGKLVKYVDGQKILFKVPPSANLLFDIKDIKNLTLLDGTKIFENGIMVVTDLKSIEKYKYVKSAGRGASFIITTAFIGVVLYFFVFKDFKLFGDDYDLCFEPNCD